jgi:hypothetical protein
MAQLLLVNPHKRGAKKRKKPMAKKRRTAAQKAATKKMIAANRRRNKPARRRSKSRAVTTTRRRRRRNPAPLMSTTRRRRRRSNPSGRGLMGLVKGTVMPAAVAGGGALATSVLMGYLPIPARFKTGPMKIAAKSLVSIGLGFALQSMGQKKLGEQMAMGGMTVAFYDGMRDIIQTRAPQIKLGDADDFDIYGEDDFPEIGYTSATPVFNGVGAIYNDGMGAIYNNGMGNAYDLYDGSMGGDYEEFDDF